MLQKARGQNPWEPTLPKYESSQASQTFLNKEFDIEQSSYQNYNAKQEPLQLQIQHIRQGEY